MMIYGYNDDEDGGRGTAWKRSVRVGIYANEQLLPVDEKGASVGRSVTHR